MDVLVRYFMIYWKKMNQYISNCGTNCTVLYSVLFQVSVCFIIFLMINYDGNDEIS